MVERRFCDYILLVDEADRAEQYQENNGYGC